MNIITKSKSEYQNVWDLNINDTNIGSVEIIYLSETNRSCKGNISIMDTNNQLVSYSYDGNVTKKTCSVAQFISAAQATINHHDIVLDKEVQEEREFDNIIFPRDVTEENVDRLASHLKVSLVGIIPQLDRVAFLKQTLIDEVKLSSVYPMADLVRKSKMSPSKPTALKYHF